MNAGNILWIDTSDILFLSLLGGISLVVISAFHKQFMAICFDPIQAKLQGVKVSTLYLLLLVLIAISIVLLSHIVGIILVITLLIIPANIAGLFVQRISRMMVLAAIIGCLLSVSGIFISYYLNTPAGASIALLSGISYLCCLLIKKKSL